MSKVIEAVVDEANLTDRFSLQKQRLRESKKRQIEAIDKQAQSSKQRVREQYKKRIEAINRVKSRTGF